MMNRPESGAGPNQGASPNQGHAGQAQSGLHARAGPNQGAYPIPKSGRARIHCVATPISEHGNFGRKI